jgi:hypothetical protein
MVGSADREAHGWSRNNCAHCGERVQKGAVLAENGVIHSEEGAPDEDRGEATPLVQGAGCSACVGFRYYPFLRSCAYWWNQYALAL